MFKNTSNEIDSVRRQIEAYGFVNFVTAAKIQVKLLAKGSADRAILEYLIQHAKGARNAKCWNEIRRHLVESGVPLITKQQFQNKLLRKSRKSTYFIGSNHKGFFIMDSPEDVARSREFYQIRIRQEGRHLGTLEFLASHCGLLPPDQRSTGPEDGLVLPN